MSHEVKTVQNEVIKSATWIQHMLREIINVGEGGELTDGLVIDHFEHCEIEKPTVVQVARFLEAMMDFELESILTAHQEAIEVKNKEIAKLKRELRMDNLFEKLS